MKVTYEINFDLPEDVPAIEVKALLAEAKSGVLGLLHSRPKWTARFHLSLPREPPSGVGGADAGNT